MWQVVCSHYRAKDTLANKQKAIFINKILIDMHSQFFFNSTQFKDILNFDCCDIIYLLVYAMYQEYDQWTIIIIIIIAINLYVYVAGGETYSGFFYKKTRLF